MPAASSPPGSHLPKKKPKKKKYNPPNIGGAIKNAGSSATKAGGGKPSKKEREAAAKAHAAVVKANVAVAKAVSTTKPSKMKKGYYTRQLGGKKASGDSLTTEDKEQLRKVRELNKEYEESSTLSKVLLPPSGVAAGDAPFMGPIKSGSNVLGAIKSIAQGGSKKAAAKAAASGTAKGAPKVAKRATPKVVTKAKTAAARAGKSVKGAPAKAGRSAKAKAKYATRPKGWEISSKAGRAAKTRRLANKGAWYVGSAGGTAVAGGGAAVINAADATVEDGKINLKPLQTTARSLKATPGALAATAGAAATGNFDKVINDTEALYDAYGRAMSTDPEVAKKAINEDIGYLNLITGGLGLARTTRELFPTKVAPEKLPLRTRRAISKAADEGNDVVSGEHLTEGKFKEMKDRSRVAQQAAAVEPRAKASMARNVKDIGGKNLRKLRRKKVGSNGVRGSDVIAFVAETGTPRNSAKGAAFIRDRVLPSIDRTRRPDTNEFTPSDVADAILENPKILDSPELAKAIEGLRTAQESVDARIAAKEGSDMPSGAAEVTQARVLGVPTREERIPPSLEGRTSVEPKMGQNAEQAIRQEAHADSTRKAPAAIRAANRKQVSALRKAERKVASVKEKLAKAKGAERTATATAKIRLERADRARLNRIPRYVKARAALNRAKGELRDAQKAYGNEARNQGSERRGTGSVEAARVRMKKAERWVVTTQAAYDATMESIFRKAEVEVSKKARGEAHDANLAALGRGRFNAVEKAAARVAEAERELGKAQLALRKIKEEGAPEANAERARAEALTKGAAEKRAVVNRMRMAANMDRIAAKLRRGLPVPEQYRDLDPDELVAAAEKLRREHLSESEAIANQTASALESARAATGAEPPVFIKGQDASRAIPVKGSTDVPWTAGSAGAKAKLREGKLWQGDASRLGGDATIQGLMRTELALSRETFHREFFNEFLYRPDGQAPKIFTEAEIRAMKKDGSYPAGYEAVALHEINGPFQKGQWSAAAGLIDSPVHAAIREARGLDGKKYGLVPKAAWSEFKKQGEAINGALRVIGKVTRGSAIALLGYNPMWFIYQLGASPLALWASHPNFVKWAKAATEVYRAHKGDNTREWENFQSKYGATSSAQFDMRSFDSVGMNPNEVKNFKNAAKTARMTWAGKTLQVLKEGPFVVGNRKYEGYIRDIGAMLEMDRMIVESRRPQFHRYAHSVADLHENVWAQIKQMDSMSPSERVKFLNSEKGQFAAREMQRRVDDAIGNWSAMTHSERQAASFLMFMPFLRFSLRWAFYAFPKNRPLTYAAALNAAQANAMQVDENTQEGSNAKGPAWESGYGMIPITDNVGLDLNRLNPASNAVTDILSGDRGPLQTALAPFTPVAGITASALAGQDPFTGEPTDKSIPEGIGEGLANLVTPLRGPLEEAQGGASVWSDLLRRVRGQPTSPVGKALMPNLVYDPQREAEAQHIQQDLMEKAFSPIPNPQDPSKDVSKNDIRLWYDPQERLNLIRAYNEKVRAQRELWAQLDKWGLKPPYELTASTIEWPIGGENKETREPPSREVYLSPREKKRFEESDRYYLNNDGGGESSSVMDQYRDTGTDIMDKYRSGTSSVMDKYR